jgi:hypothetical protein
MSAHSHAPFLNAQDARGPEERESTVALATKREASAEAAAQRCIVVFAPGERASAIMPACHVRRIIRLD